MEDYRTIKPDHNVQGEPHGQFKPKHVRYDLGLSNLAEELGNISKAANSCTFPEILLSVINPPNKKVLCPNTHSNYSGGKTTLAR